jgi:hypothetical protein
MAEYVLMELFNSGNWNALNKTMRLHGGDGIAPAAGRKEGEE